jgi:phosphoglycolate phosphatase-like HAD superfamily hydrolase
MKSLYQGIPWNEIEVIGFDLDGTLYNEFEFISQVYRPIASELSKFTLSFESEIYAKMISRWKEKGSTYNKIFEEILVKSDIGTQQKEEVIRSCLSIYHNFKPEIKLSRFVRDFLIEVCENYKLFIVTDGNVQLQKAKFDCLGLDNWFKQENLGFCGAYGPDFAKPSIRILKTLEIFRLANPLPSVLYFGDRQVDMIFASNSGFHFSQVHCLIPVVGSI